MRNVALVYVRKSFIRKGEETVSPERQLAACRDYCERKGWKVQVFQDADEGVHYSGRFEKTGPDGSACSSDSLIPTLPPWSSAASIGRRGA